ncbi:hypothetical protein [Cellulomonas sp.]|jgi:glucan phosphoethanolaminetransferase (alkaline phosphatase superfamily)|uniref:hypothetical protein n=1 Tax=Cellulomonas sp. TaxID=40001 RepID=UPI0025C6A67B|nr:hypothetical protein [Cellulomonas sp.]
MELLVPPTYDLLWSVAVLAVLPLTVLALLRWRAVPTRHPVLWLLAILLLPVLGAVVFLAWAPRGVGGREPR